MTWADGGLLIGFLAMFAVWAMADAWLAVGRWCRKRKRDLRRRQYTLPYYV